MDFHNCGFMKKELALRIPVSTKLRLEMIANKENRTLNSLVGKIIQDYIETENSAKNRATQLSVALYKFKYLY